MSNELRRTHLVNRRLQVKLVVRLALMMTVTSLMVVLIFVGSRFFVAFRMGDPAMFTVLDELGSLFFEALIWWLGGYIVLFAYFAYRFSHEIAGPLFRFERALTGIAERGNLDEEIHLRSDDDPEFHALAELYNRALSRLRSARERVRAASTAIAPEQTDDTTPEQLEQSLERCQDELQAALDGLGDDLRPGLEALEDEATPQDRHEG